MGFAIIAVLSIIAAATIVFAGKVGSNVPTTPQARVLADPQGYSELTEALAGFAHTHAKPAISDMAALTRWVDDNANIAWTAQALNGGSNNTPGDLLHREAALRNEKTWLL